MATQSSKPASVHDFTVKDAKGNDVDLSQYKGKVLLIVNVASQCGLTNSNYTELAKVYEKYKNQGLEILAFPCNQFGSQEQGTNEEIVEFACTRFKAEYPIFDKFSTAVLLLCCVAGCVGRWAAVYRVLLGFLGSLATVVVVGLCIYSLLVYLL